MGWTWPRRARAAARRRRLVPVLVAGRSMTPTLPPGARLAVVTPALPPRRGQVVLVRYPGRDLELVKRVVGLPGERVTLLGDALLIDGEALLEPYTGASGRRPSAAWTGAPAGPPGEAGLDLTLGPGQYLVLGDRREASTDGRAFGPVDLGDIAGTVRLAYWPPSAWRARLRG